MRNPFFVAFAACALIGALGCEPAYAPPPAPAPPPPPRALTVEPQRNQSKAQMDRDQTQCQNTASAQATSSEGWAQMFAACMSGRGYGVH